jgi:acyl-CoA synthetase (AMP-forming)/AMP-acid ligase II
MSSERPWLAHYPAGVPAEIDLDEFASINDFAGYLLHELKLKKGDRVAIMLPNCLQYPIAMFGVLRAGLTVVNTNPMYTARELKHQLVDPAPACDRGARQLRATWPRSVAGDPVKHVITTGIGDMLGFPKGADRQLRAQAREEDGPRIPISPAPCVSATPSPGPHAPLAGDPTSRPRTSPSCNTPAAPPAWPRARC